MARGLGREAGRGGSDLQLMNRHEDLQLCCPMHWRRGPPTRQIGGAQFSGVMVQLGMVGYFATESGSAQMAYLWLLPRPIWPMFRVSVLMCASRAASASALALSHSAEPAASGEDSCGGKRPLSQQMLKDEVI